MNKKEIVSLIEKDFATKKVADYLTDMPADVKTLFSYLDNKFDHKSTSVGMPVKFDNPRVRDFFHLAHRAINGQQYGDNNIDHKAIFIKKYGQKTYDAILKVLDNNRIYLKNGGFISIDTSKFGAGKIDRIVFMFPQIYSGVEANVDLYLSLKSKYTNLLDEWELSFISEVEKIINKAELDNFDWSSVYAELTPEEEADLKLKQKEEVVNEKENWYQQSKWSKKYAPTYKDAVEKTKKEYLEGKKTFKDWGSRVYKSNKGVVYAGGDDIHGDSYTIGGINENRRRNVLKGAKMQMDEAIANLKELGVPEAEINELIENKENKEMIKGDKIFDNKKNKFGTIVKKHKPKKGTFHENEEYLIDVKYDGEKTIGAINMPIGDRFVLASKLEKEMTKEQNIQDKFELGTPVVYHSKNYKGEPIEQSGEIVMNKIAMFYPESGVGRKLYEAGTLKGISLYKDANYSGDSFRFVVPEWDNVETFYENSKRVSEGKPFEIKSVDAELEKGKAVEMEHKETLEKVASGKITAEEAIVETAETHIAEDPKYYDKLEEMESKQKTTDFEGSSTGTGALYEFFTPDEVVKKMWQLAYDNGFKSGSILEPALGSGRLLKYAPKGCSLTAFEINKNNVEVANKMLSKYFENIDLHNDRFETAFLQPPRFNSRLKKEGTWLKNAPFDLAIANPPYGEFTGLYKSYFKFSGQFEHWFIEYSMKLVKSGGLGVFLIPSSFMRNGISYNQVKERIFADSKLLDAYRLPANIFKKTQIGTDIIILKKK